MTLNKEMFHLKNIFVLILLLILFLDSHSLDASKVSSAAKIENIIKSKIKEIIGNQIKSEMYYLTVKVDENSIPTENKTESVPFSNLKIDPKVLEKAVGGAVPEEYQEIKFEIQLVFDTSTPEKIKQLISEEISHHFRMDGSSKKLTTSEAAIITKEINDTAAKEIEIETLKLESEKVRLEKERLEFEAKQKEAELSDSLRKKQEELDDAKKAKEELAKTQNIKPEEKKEEPKVEVAKEPTLIDMIKDFQIILLSVIAGLLIFVSSLISGMMKSKGMKNLSTAIQSVGEGIQSAATAKDSSNSAGGSDIAVGDKDEAKNPIAETQNSNSADNVHSAERMNEFLLLVEEKISVLSKEGNLAFYRHFIDMIDENPIFANSILVSVSQETARILVDNISSEYIDKIKIVMSEDGALSKAQQLRGPALQEFYGKISLDEFTGSPLLNIKNINWLSKLQNSQLLSLVLELKANERSQFLACFTPARLVSILNQCQDEKQRDDIIEALKDADQVDSENIEEIFTKSKEVWDKLNKNREQSAKKLIDGPRFYAKMIQDLKGDVKENLLNKLSSRADLMEEIKQYYIPFTDLEKLTSETLKSIFGKRPTNQVAVILNSTSKEIRELVIGCMPEMLQDTIREELASFDAEENRIKIVSNKSKSLELQDEICRYLLKMNKEGLLAYKDDDEGKPSLVSAA